MKRETLKVTWKIIRRKGHGRTPESYCNYIIENENHKHRLKTKEGTKLFDILDNTTILKEGSINEEVLVDGIYWGKKLLFVTNFRKIGVE